MPLSADPGSGGNARWQMIQRRAHQTPAPYFELRRPCAALLRHDAARGRAKVSGCWSVIVDLRNFRPAVAAALKDSRRSERRLEC